MPKTVKKNSSEKRKRTTAKRRFFKRFFLSKSRKKHTSFKWKLFKFTFITTLICAFLITIYILYCYLTMPNIQESVSKPRQPYTIIMAENGNDIAKFGNVYAQIIYPDDLPKNLTDAIIAIEDKRFYSHFGFDIIGFSRALFTNIFKKRYAQGASTITQQVAKNIFLTPNKNIKRKVQELLLAFWLEKKFTKNQIMALYLNRVYFGSGNYGAEAAANWYFNKSSHNLNLREAALLAGMLKAPNRYNPILRSDEALKRAEIVLQNMQKNNFITMAQYNQAKSLTISDGQQYRVTGGRHFAQYVYDEVNDFIGERADDIVVITTLDQRLQEIAEQTLRQKIASAQAQNVHEGAVIIMDKSGAIKAMVGGVDYNRSQFNRAVQAKRQAGSAFKPFVYLTALQYGFAPDSTVNDTPIAIGKWKPENYTKRYYGNVTLSYALTHSLNVATVALSKELYLRDIAANAYKMGINSKLKLTPSMVLGTNNVSLLDMITAYTVIANGGYKVIPYAIHEISTQDGRQLYVRKANQPTQIIDSAIVSNLTKMMQNVVEQGTGHSAKLPIFAAGKTGTTQNYRDAWFIGWTNKYITAVWVGNDDEKPMKKIGGGNLPAQIWHDIMLHTINETPKNAPVFEQDDAISNLIENTDDIGLLIEQETATTSDLGELIDAL